MALGDGVILEGELPAPEGPRRPIESRGATALWLLLAFQLIVIVIGASSLSGSPTFVDLVLGAAVAGMVIELVMAIALGQGSPWAVVAVRPMLQLIFALDVAEILLELAHGTIHIPIAAVISGWALRAPPSPRPLPAFTPAAALAIGGFVLATAAGVGLPLAIGPGGLLDLRASDLAASLSADCSPTGGAQAAQIHVTYHWSWRHGMVLPSGEDEIVIKWSGGSQAADADPTAQPYLLGDTGNDPVGVVGGTEVGDNAALAAQFIGAGSLVPGLESPSGPPGQSWWWTVELADQHLDPGAVTVTLQRSSDQPDPGPGFVMVSAEYIHAASWTASPESVTCNWGGPP